MSPESGNSDTSSAAWRPDGPDQALPTLPPPEELESKIVLKQCIESRAALAELRQAVLRVADPTMLIRTLPVLEAQASSGIENIITTADQLFQHVDPAAAPDPATKEALRYRKALEVGLESLKERPLCTATAEFVCSAIKGHPMRVRSVPGTTLRSGSSGEVIYTPPVGEPLLRDMLANWERFLHERTELDPLVRLAVGHYQFEAIHPFVDGNGRTGRILNSLFLVEQELLTLPVLYLSRYVIRTRSEYYARLLDVTREQAWEPWILYVLRGIEQTAVWTTDKTIAIVDLQRETAKYVQERRPKLFSLELVRLIFHRPYCRIGDVVRAGIAQRQAASRYLKALVEIGVLREEPVGREKLFIHHKLLRLLTRDEHEVVSYR